MKKTTRRGIVITSIVLGVIAVVGIISDLSFSEVLEKEIKKEISALSYQTVHVDDVHLLIGARTLVIEGLYYNPSTLDSLVADTTGAEISIKQLWVEGISIHSILKEHRCKIKRINVVEPLIRANVVKNMTIESFINDSLLAEIKNNKSQMKDIQSTEIDQVVINRGKLDVHSLDTHLDFYSDSVSLTLNDLSTRMDSVGLQFNDSVYALEIHNIHVTTPDNHYCATVGEISHVNVGEVVMRDVHAWSPIHKNKLADACGKIPVIWPNIRLDEVRTSAINPFRTAQAKALTLDSLYFHGPSADIFRDARYKPKKPYEMPQEMLLAMPVPVKINHFVGGIGSVKFSIATTDVNSGDIRMQNFRLDVANVSNKKGSEMKAKISMRFNNAGKADVNMNFINDKACSYNGSLVCKEMEIGHLDHLTKPLIGIVVDCNVNDLKLDFTGDAKVADGTFCMLYDGLKITAFQGDYPIKAIAKNAKAINFFGNLLLPKSNPSKGQKVREYKVHTKRDPMKVFPVVFVGLCTDGVMSTLLPGASLQKRVKSTPTKDKK